MNEIKAIAMYLPQFHQVTENDIWWGEGFTEWTTVRNAESIYPGHEQPKYPFGRNYYDLMDKSTVKWQADLMHKYDIYGLCYYHYWFKDGRRILEKPAENLLVWKDIQTPFCFCWANETWSCSWSNIRSGNVWAGKFETGNMQGANGILLEQKYGDIGDWEKHFFYLLPFFKDDRYIKKDQKPVFLIYKPLEIYCLEEMILRWNELAKNEGFNGIYVIGANSDDRVKNILDAELIHEPQATLLEKYGFADAFEKRKGMERVALYDDVWRNILDRDNRNNVYYGGFCKYDDTPRRGKNGVVIEGDTPEKFKQYLAKIYAKNLVAGNEFVFINAWNEWGEGMYLEPDEKDKDSYLNAFSYADEYCQFELHHFRERNGKENGSLIEMWKEKCDRYEGYWKVLHKWMQLKEENKRLCDYLLAKEYRNIGIYGMGMMARHLQKELADTDVKIVFGIDKKAKSLKSDILLYTPEDNFPEVDVVVVTVAYEYYSIADYLKGKGIKKVLSLEEIVEECEGALEYE